MALRKGFPSRPPPWLSTVVTYTTNSADQTRNVTSKKITTGITLHQVERDDEDLMKRHGRPQTTVLFFPFLYAPTKAAEQYRNLYHSRGMDVIHITGDIKYFMWPRNGQRLARELLDYLTSNETPLNVDHFFVHAMSIGCYLWTLLLMESVANPDKYGSVLRKVNGQVFDSITVGGVDRMVTGVSKIVNNAFASIAIKYSAWIFLNLTKSYTKDIHDVAIETFKSMPVTAPVLLFYALNDPMSHAGSMEELINQWRSDARFEVHTKCWERSVHSAHLKEHPEQYKKTLESFLQLVGIEQLRANL